MQEKLSYMAALQSKEQIETNIQALLIEQKALLANADQQIKQARHNLYQAIAMNIADRIGADGDFMTRLVKGVFGLEKALNNLEPLQFQLHFHLKEMKKLRETFSLMEKKGLIEIDHIFTNDKGERFSINSYIKEVKANIDAGRFINPMTNEVMTKQEFYSHYSQIVHTTYKYIMWVEDAQTVNTIQMPMAATEKESLYRAVA